MYHQSMSYRVRVALLPQTGRPVTSDPILLDPLERKTLSFLFFVFITASPLYEDFWTHRYTCYSSGRNLENIPFSVFPHPHTKPNHSSRHQSVSNPFPFFLLMATPLDTLLKWPISSYLNGSIREDRNKVDRAMKPKEVPCGENGMPNFPHCRSCKFKNKRHPSFFFFLFLLLFPFFTFFPT